MERQGLPALALVVAILLSGCTSLFFQPSATRYPYLEVDKLSAETVTLKSKDGTKISAWKISSIQSRKNHPEIVPAPNLKPNEVRGIALQFHGNAQNMSTHYRFQLWLLFEGWDVLTFDYRGYGLSGGDPTNLKGVREDGAAALEWASQVAKEKNLPLVVFGQSLGASIAINSLLEYRPEPLRLLVLDSGFYSFTSIAREKLSDVWFLWPFQWLGWLLVSNELSAGPKLASLASGNSTSARALSTPAIFLHSLTDPIVSNQQGQRLFAAYPSEKVRWTTHEPGHVNTLFAEPNGENPPRTPYREKLKLRLREIQRSWLAPEIKPVTKEEKLPASR